MASTESRFEVIIEPRSEDREPSDHRWLSDVADLKHEVKSALRDEDGDLLEREMPVDGTKGGVPEIVLALGTSGAISAAVVAFQAWLARGRNREIVIRRREGTKVTEVSVKAIGISEAHVVSSLRTALTPPPRK